MLFQIFHQPGSHLEKEGCCFWGRIVGIGVRMGFIAAAVTLITKRYFSEKAISDVKPVTEILGGVQDEFIKGQVTGIQIYLPSAGAIPMLILNLVCPELGLLIHVLHGLRTLKTEELFLDLSRHIRLIVVGIVLDLERGTGQVHLP